MARNKKAKPKKEKEYITLVPGEEEEKDFDLDSADLLDYDDSDLYFDGDCCDCDGRKVLLWLAVATAIIGAIIAIVCVNASKESAD